MLELNDHMLLWRRPTFSLSKMGNHGKAEEEEKPGMMERYFSIALGPRIISLFSSPTTTDNVATTITS